MPSAKPPSAVTVDSFIESIQDEAKRADTKALIKVISGLTKQRPTMYGSSVIAFGSYRFTYDNGRQEDLPLACFSPRKSAFVIYGLGSVIGVQPLLAKLGKHSAGEGCLYIKKLADVDKNVLQELIGLSIAAKRQSGNP